MHNAELAVEFIQEHDPDGTWFRDPNYDGSIDETKVPELALALLDFIANVVSTILDAGSERDAVNENEGLLDALGTELMGWTMNSDDAETLGTIPTDLHEARADIVSRLQEKLGGVR